MNRVLVALLIFFSICLIACAQEWIQYKDTNMSYDGKSIRRTPVLQRVKILTKIRYNTPLVLESGILAGSTLDYREFDCLYNRFRITKSEIYDESGNILITIKKPEHWQEVVEGSTIEDLYKMLCAPKQPKRSADKKEFKFQTPDWGKWKPVKNSPIEDI